MILKEFYLECNLNTAASHAETHRIHVHVIRFSSWDIRKLDEGVRCLSVFVDWNVYLNLRFKGLIC